MKTNLLFIIPILFYTSISFSQDYGDSSELCKELYEMVLNDQKFRGSNIKFNEEFPLVLDSLLLLKGISKETFSGYSELQQHELRSKTLKIVLEKRKSMMIQNDSLRILQDLIDEENTAKLIKIVKERGWLTAENLNCQQRFQIVLIFRHAPKKYWKEIRALIEKEKSEKRLSDYEYYTIDNHLKGRPPLTKDFSDYKKK